ESAINLSGAMTLQRTMLAGSGPAERVDVFAYAAGPTNGVDILKIPKEFVGAIETNALLSSAEVDVTAWIHEFAGRKLGIMLALPEQVSFNNRQYGFSQFAI